MEQEMIVARDENGAALRVAARKEIHEGGMWHETFHCWIVEMVDGAAVIHLQMRSKEKKDFPDLLDISAAGHILAHETVEDGIREIEEELGIEVEFDELIPLGIIKDQIAMPNFLDNERCHVFLYKTEKSLDKRYRFQEEEVAGMYKFDFQEFADLCAGAAKEIDSKGALAAIGNFLPRRISLTDIVPHGERYLKQVVQRIQTELENGKTGA